jgi:CheY-like chemotaxis protein
MEFASGRDVGAGRTRPPSALHDAPRERAYAGRPIVLLVDDIEDCRDVYGQFLAHAGYQVVEAGCQAYLVKPCLPMDVAAEVGRLLAETRAGGAERPQVRVLEEDARALPEAAARLVRRRLADMQASREALVRHLEALKVIARSADVRITIPARRSSPKRP